MKRIIPIVCSLLAVSAGAFAQDPAIDKPLMAAPGQLKATATVIKWKADFTYDTLKKGTGKLVCYDKTKIEIPPAISAMTGILPEHIKKHGEGIVRAGNGNSGFVDSPGRCDHGSQCAF